MAILSNPMQVVRGVAVHRAVRQFVAERSGRPRLTFGHPAAEECIAQFEKITGAILRPGNREDRWTLHSYLKAEAGPIADDDLLELWISSERGASELQGRSESTPLQVYCDGIATRIRLAAAHTMGIGTGTLPEEIARMWRVAIIAEGRNSGLPSEAADAEVADRLALREDFLADRDAIRSVDRAHWLARAMYIYDADAEIYDMLTAGAGENLFRLFTLTANLPGTIARPAGVSRYLHTPLLEGLRTVAAQIDLPLPAGSVSDFLEFSSTLPTLPASPRHHDALQRLVRIARRVSNLMQGNGPDYVPPSAAIVLTDRRISGDFFRSPAAAADPDAALAEFDSTVGSAASDLGRDTPPTPSVQIDRPVETRFDAVVGELSIPSRAEANPYREGTTRAARVRALLWSTLQRANAELDFATAPQFAPLRAAIERVDELANTQRGQLDRDIASGYVSGILDALERITNDPTLTQAYRAAWQAALSGFRELELESVREGM